MGCNVSVLDTVNQKCRHSPQYGQTDLHSANNTSIEHVELNLEKFISEAIVFGNRVEAVKKFLQNECALQSFMNFLESEQSNSDLFKEIEHIVESNEDLEKAAISLVQKYNFPEVIIQLPPSSYSLKDSFQYEMYEGEGTICCSDSDGSVRGPSQCHNFNRYSNSPYNNFYHMSNNENIVTSRDLHDYSHNTDEGKCADMYCQQQLPHHQYGHDNEIVLDNDHLQQNIVHLLSHIKSLSRKEKSCIPAAIHHQDDHDKESSSSSATCCLMKTSPSPSHEILTPRDNDETEQDDDDNNDKEHSSHHPHHSIDHIITNSITTATAAVVDTIIISPCFKNNPTIMNHINNSNHHHPALFSNHTNSTNNNNNSSNNKSPSGMSSISTELKEMYKKAQREILFMIAMDSIPRYLESDYYKEWREEEVENNYTGAQLMLELEKREGLEYSYKDICGDLNSLHLDPQSNNTSSYIRRAFAALDPLEVQNIARSSFLSVFLGSVEGLPISVSLSTANPNRPGFPLIYVNAIFEETTGYTRQEIIGRNCKFLQADKAEQESIMRLTRALAGAKPVKVEITNYRKNGEPFRNLLAMKPIFDQNGKYAYVVGLQFDVSNEESASLSKLQYIDYLLSMLPDRLPFDDGANEE